MGRPLYFCTPPNPTLLGYWDIVADRLFKIRNSENIPGCRAATATLRLAASTPACWAKRPRPASTPAARQRPQSAAGPLRSLVLIQKALEIASEVRALGNVLLSATEKGDAEHLSLCAKATRFRFRRMAQNVRFLQWKHAQETTNGLLQSRSSALERYTYYLRLLGLAPDSTTVPAAFASDQRELTEANFDDAYSALVSEYNQTITPLAYPQLQLAQGSSPSTQSGASGQGQLYLNTNEDAELNTHLPTARDARTTANVANSIASGLFPIPSAELHLAFWGIGAHSNLLSGTSLSGVAKLAADVAQIVGASSDRPSRYRRAHGRLSAPRRRMDVSGQSPAM